MLPPERHLGVGQHDFDHALDEIGLDRRVGPAFDADRGLPAAAAEQHVDDRVDQARVDGDQPEIVPLLGLEHAEDRGQRNRIEIIAEAHRCDAVERNFNVVGREVAQARRHQPHETVEDDLEHRQALVRDHRRVDDRAYAGIVVEADIGQAETEQAVDFFLIENSFGAAFGALIELRAGVHHRRPLRGGGVLAFARRAVSGRGAAFGFERKAPLGGQRVLVDLVFLRHELKNVPLGY
jgi:hypothetical protein